MDTVLSTSRTGRYLFDEDLLGQIKGLGLGLRIEFDMEAWKDFICTTDWPVVNASADPARHDFRAGEVFWLHLYSGGSTVATQVLRVIDTDDYVDLIRSHRLWFGDGPSEFADARMLCDDPPHISGTVVQLSGLYIVPSWRRVLTARGMRLVAAFTRLTHDFTLRNLAPDWSVTLVEQRVSSPRIMHELYGYPHAEKIFEAYFPYVGHMERMTMLWMSHAELAALSGRLPRPVARSLHLAVPMARLGADSGSSLPAI